MIGRAMLHEQAQRDVLSAARREGQTLLRKPTGSAHEG